MCDFMLCLRSLEQLEQITSSTQLGPEKDARLGSSDQTQSPSESIPDSPSKSYLHDSGTSEDPWTGTGVARGLSDALREVGGLMKLHAPHGPAVLELRRWASSVFCQGSAMAEDIRTDSGVLFLRGRVCGGCVVGRH